VLRRDGFDDAKTVAHFLLDEKLQNSLRNGTVVCDESSMLGHKDAGRFFQLADKLNLKVTLVGDPMQHGSVPRGALLRLLKHHAGIKEFRLSEIMRQQDAGYRSAVEALADGRTLEGFNALDALGWVHEIEDDRERNARLAADYVQAQKDKVSCLVVSPTHAEARDLTQEIRAQLRAAGLLGEQEHRFTRLVAVNASEAERGQESTYRHGPLVVQFHQNARGFVKGDRLRVDDATPVPLNQADKFSLYREDAIALSVGDKLRFTGTVKTLDGEHTLKNGAVRTIRDISGDRITLDNGWVVSGKQAGHFRHGVVDTSFGSQGKTVSRVLLGMSAASAGAMSREQFYVSASRGKHKLTLYTDDKAEIRSAIRRSSHKLAALDLRRAKPDRTQEMVAFQADLAERLRQIAYYDLLRNDQAGRQPDTLPALFVPTHAQRRNNEDRSVGHER
jgi:ATP-dependent exoDNAse (exonuclease V) alpha subunit